jgi:hypothetical protein
MNVDSGIHARSLRLAPSIAMSLMLSFTDIATALGQDLPAEETTEQGHTQMDQINLANPEGELVAPEAPKETSPFFRDTKWNAQLRSLHFDNEKYDGNTIEACTGGGSISYLSG